MKATCPNCKREIELTKAGTFELHGPISGDECGCSMSYEFPPDSPRERLDAIQVDAANVATSLQNVDALKSRITHLESVANAYSEKLTVITDAREGNAKLRAQCKAFRDELSEIEMRIKCGSALQSDAARINKLLSENPEL